MAFLRLIPGQPATENGHGYGFRVVYTGYDGSLHSQCVITFERCVAIKIAVWIRNGSDNLFL